MAFTLISLSKKKQEKSFYDLTKGKKCDRLSGLVVEQIENREIERRSEAELESVSLCECLLYTHNEMGVEFKFHWRKETKGNRRNTGNREPMKDAASCEKSRGDASDLRSVSIRMGKPYRRRVCSC